MKFQISTIKKGISTLTYIAMLLFITLSIASVAQLHQLINNNQRVHAAIKKDWINNDPDKEAQFTLYQQACVFHDKTTIKLSLFEHTPIGGHVDCAERMGVGDYYRHLVRFQNRLHSSFPLNLIATRFNVIME